ncbi:MAG: pitrilysin family protein [Acidobacteria bacterium]|nr:pitrilysin family protein [Acidobacteriota bacterium]
MKSHQATTFLFSLFCLPTLAMASSTGLEDMISQIDIPYQRFVLENGLTLIVHEDHKVPIVAVNVWYHVGSKDESPGRSGFAHLFEHLMFNGSEHFDNDYFQALERVGATDLNGTTNNDRTNYFQNVPTSALDLVCWMESDRMGHMLGAITQEKLDEQRGVVQNEKRQGENRPYGVTRELIVKNTYPSGHPYSWTVIGSMEDLNAAQLEDVREWFRSSYGPNNAVIVIAGDVDAETALRTVEKYFGNIPAGPPVAQQKVWIAKMTGTHRQTVQDHVPQARIEKVWNVPEWGSADADYLSLVGNVLASGKTSRLYKRLVYDDQIATDVSASARLREIGGQFRIRATARPGEELARVEAAIDEELERFLEKGPTERELQRVKTQFMSRFIRGIERVGGFGGKSDILATNEVYGGRPDYYKTTLQRVGSAQPADLTRAAKRWLSDGVYILEVHPFPEFKTTGTDVDRSRLPQPGMPPQPDFPELRRATLSNGLKVIVSRRRSVPLINFNLLVDAGYAADRDSVPGVASLAMDMLDEGTSRRSALEISEELAHLGARLRTGSNLDLSTLSLSALKSELDSSLEIYADVILNPTFPEQEFKRLQQEQLARIQREKTTPTQMVLRVFPGLLYGRDHAYGNPFTGSGTEESVSSLTNEDLINFYRTWFKPNNATLVVVGDTTLQEIVPRLEKHFQPWQAGPVPAKNLPVVEQRLGSAVYLVNKPAAVQSIIFATHVAPPANNPDELAIDTMNLILGGTFTSRINMNLREDKGWSYGARSSLYGARGQRPFVVRAPVQTDRTKESIVEILKELRQITADRPPTEEEFVKIRENRILRLPGSWETIAAVGNSIADVVRYGLPDDHYETYPEKLRNLKLAQVSEAAQRLIHADRLIWVIVGDLAKIEKGIRELNLGEIYRVDADGNPAQ